MSWQISVSENSFFREYVRQGNWGRMKWSVLIEFGNRVDLGRNGVSFLFRRHEIPFWRRSLKTRSFGTAPKNFPLKTFLFALGEMCTKSCHIYFGKQ